MRRHLLGVFSAAAAAAATLTFSAALPSAGAATPLVITTSSLAPVYEGAVVSVPLKATGGGFIKTWHVTSGVLPAGVTLSSGGTLKGAPTTAGSYAFAVQVNSGSQASPVQSLTWQVKAMEITSPGPGTAPIDQNIRVTQLTVKGGTAPYAWSITAGHLPMGMTMTTGGRISGQSHFPGISTFTVLVTDAKNRLAAREYQIEVLPMSIITPGLPHAAKGRYYSASLQATGGKGTLAWTVVGGALPPGLKLSKGGVITGVPTASGWYTVTIDVHETNLILPAGARRTFLLIVD